MSMRVCMVSPMPPPYGGISHWTSMIVDHAATKNDVSISVIDISPRWRDVHDTGRMKRAFGGAIQLVRDALRLFFQLVRRRPHVVHLTTPGGMAVVRDVVMLGMSKILGIPSVYHIRFGRAPALLADHSGMESLLFCLACHLASKVIAIDAATYVSLTGSGYENKSQLIPNCYNGASLPASRGGASKVVLYIGWVIPTKGIAELLDAWKTIERNDGWRLILVGPVDAAFKVSLEQHVASTAVSFAGEMAHADAMSMLAEADILVLPSHSEGFPNVVLEGMALGKPVLATAVGAIPEMLSDGAGVVVPAKNTPALSEGLRSLMDDPDRRQLLGRQARVRAQERYSLDSVFLSYQALWRSLSRQ